MTEYSTVSIYKQDSAKLDLIAICLKKEKRDIMNLLLSELQNILEISIQNEVKKGNVQLFYNLMLHRVGNKLSVAFVPNLDVISSKVPMNSKAPSVTEIESRCFASKKKNFEVETNEL